MKKEEFKKYKLPDTSGVYFFLDKKLASLSPALSQRKGEVLPLGKDLGWAEIKKHTLYVGKATILKDRVGSYFNTDQVIKSRGTRIASMVENAKDIFYIEALSALEAIILESKYIKELKPFFNIKEMDDRSYSYVIITKEDFPRVLIVRGREIEKDFEGQNNLKMKSKFGPFISRMELLEIMKFIRKIFPYRDKCKIGEKRGCFSYQIGLCPGTCIGKISKKDYQKSIKNIEKILSGNIRGLLKDLESEMKIRAKEKEFEEAAKVRNKINAFNYIKDINLIKGDRAKKIEGENVRIESYDVSHISGKERVGVMVVVEDGELKKSEYKKFKLKEGMNDDLAGISEILERRFAHTEWKYPDILVIDGGKTHLNFVYNKLKSLLPPKDLEKISLFSVVKDQRHKAREVISLHNVDKLKKEKYKDLIILANKDTHRFAISYHKLRRNKIKKF